MRIHLDEAVIANLVRDFALPATIGLSAAVILFLIQRLLWRQFGRRTSFLASLLDQVGRIAGIFPWVVGILLTLQFVPHEYRRHPTIRYGHRLVVILCLILIIDRLITVAL